MQINLVVAAVAALPVVAVAGPPKHNAPAKITVTSPAFARNGAIPADFTCEGTETTPPLEWSGVPDDTRTIALLVEDPEGPFTNWLVTNLPAGTTALIAGGALPQPAMVAKNDKGNLGYAGPCPESGRHHYTFFIYALDTSVPRPDSRDAFMTAIHGHVLAQGELTALYQKRK